MSKNIKLSSRVIDRLKAEGFVSRAAAVDRNIINEEERTIRTVLATETPALVFDWERWDIVREILIIDEGSVMLPETRQVPLIDSHMRSTTKNLKGSIRGLNIENHELIGFTRFSSLAEEEWTNAREGHLTDVSVGYNTFPEYTIVVAPGEQADVGGRIFKNDYEDKKTLLIRTRWQPKEGSLVIVGADPKAQFRSAEDAFDISAELENFKAMIDDQLNLARKEIKEIKNHIIIKGDSRMEPKQVQTPSVEEIRAQELQRIKEIEALGERFAGKAPNLKDKAREAIKEGKSVEEFRNYILDNLDDSAPIEKPATQLDMSKKELARYSISKAVLAAANNDWSNAGLEREASLAIEKALGRSARENAFFLPYEVQLKGARTLNAGTGSAGGYLVGTDNLESEFIELLRNEAVLGAAGMRMLTGLKENITIPKQNGSVSVSMVAENTAASQSFPSFSQLSGSPKTATANTEFGRRLLIQSNPSVDRLVYEDLYQQIAQKVDVMGLYGTGASNEPTGVANTTGIGIVDMSTTVDWRGIVKHSTNILKSNIKLNRVKWITNADVREKLMTTQRAQNTDSFLMKEDGKCAGFDSFITENVSGRGLFFGDWYNLIFLEWGVVELQTDPYTKSTSGIIVVTIFDEFDFIVRYPGAFSYSSAVAA